MRVEIGEHRCLTLSEVYNPIAIKTDAGIFFVVQCRSGIEIRHEDGLWFSWDEKGGPVEMNMDWLDERTRKAYNEEAK